MILDGDAVRLARHCALGHIDHADVARGMRRLGWAGASAQWVRLVEDRAPQVGEAEATALAAVLHVSLFALLPVPEGVVRLPVRRP